MNWLYIIVVAVSFSLLILGAIIGTILGAMGIDILLGSENKMVRRRWRRTMCKICGEKIEDALEHFQLKHPEKLMTLVAMGRSSPL